MILFSLRSCQLEGRCRHRVAITILINIEPNCDYIPVTQYGALLLFLLLAFNEIYDSLLQPDIVREA